MLADWQERSVCLFRKESAYLRCSMVVLLLLCCTVYGVMQNNRIWKQALWTQIRDTLGLQLVFSLGQGAWFLRTEYQELCTLAAHEDRRRKRVESTGRLNDHDDGDDDENRPTPTTAIPRWIHANWKSPDATVRMVGIVVSCERWC